MTFVSDCTSGSPTAVMDRKAIGNKRKSGDEHSGGTGRDP
jgi:hypothetical protein